MSLTNSAQRRGWMLAVLFVLCAAPTADADDGAAAQPAAAGKSGAVSRRAGIRRDPAESDRFSLALMMEFDGLPKAIVRDELYVQRWVYRPALQLEQTVSCEGCVLQFAFAEEVSYSRGDRFFGGDDAQLQLSHLWISGYGLLRSRYGVLALDWFRLRLSLGPARLTAKDRVADLSDSSWRVRGEVAGFVGLRLWSFFVVQGGVAYVFGREDFEVGAAEPTDTPKHLDPQEGPALVLRTGIEYRFGSP